MQLPFKHSLHLIQTSSTMQILQSKHGWKMSLITRNLQHC